MPSRITKHALLESHDACTNLYDFMHAGGGTDHVDFGNVSSVRGCQMQASIRGPALAGGDGRATTLEKELELSNRSSMKLRVAPCLLLSGRIRTGSKAHKGILQARS